MENVPQEKKRQELMEFRYALIAELSNPFLTRGRQRELLEAKAAQLYKIPYSTKQRITVSCLKDRTDCRYRESPYYSFPARKTQGAREGGTADENDPG